MLNENILNAIITRKTRSHKLEFEIMFYVCIKQILLYHTKLLDTSMHKVDYLYYNIFQNHF